MHNAWNTCCFFSTSLASSVFDVTKGRAHYGPGGSYHHFAGRFQSYMSHSPSVSVLLLVSSVNNLDEQADVVYVELMTSPIYSFEL